MNVEKSLFWAALVGSCVVIGNSQPIGDRDIPDSPEVETLISAKRPKLNRPVHTPPCGLNQYFDQEEGRCLGVPGGGRLIHVDNIQFCEKNTLQPHCSSPQYYYICKFDKTLLAKCVDGQHFENRLQRCVYVHPDTLSPYSTAPVQESYDQLSLPACTKPGRFPVPNNCAVFYTCDTNGHRLHRSVFKCPENTGFHPESGTCNPTNDCTNRDALKKICVPPAPDDAISRNVLNENSENSADSIPPEESEKNLEEIQEDNSFVDPNVENRLQENPSVPENSKNAEELPETENIGSDGTDELSETEKLSEVPEVINDPAENLENKNLDTGNEEVPFASNLQPAENSNIDQTQFDEKLTEEKVAEGEESESSILETVDLTNLPEKELPLTNENSKVTEESPETANIELSGNEKLSETEKLPEVPVIINNQSENIENENTEIAKEEIASVSNSQPAEDSNIDETSVEKKLEEHANGEELGPSNTELLNDSSNLTEEKSAPINERTGENLNQTPPTEEVPQSASEVTNLKTAESVESIPDNGPASENIDELTTHDLKNFKTPI